VNIVRLTQHRDDEFVVLSIPPDLRHAIGSFAPARYMPDQKAYVIHEDTVGALHAWARYNGARVLDDRPHVGEARPGHECAHCQQPGSVPHPPRYCPGCGERWQPVTFFEVAPRAPVTVCEQCGHKQTGRFARCAGCGARMRYPRRSAPPLELVRTHLADPVPVAEAVASVKARVLHGRGITDTDLPPVTNEGTGDLPVAPQPESERDAW
jgi:hypothetical protein